MKTNGLGIQKNIQEARKYYTRAQEEGNQEAKSALIRVASICPYCHGRGEQWGIYPGTTDKLYTCVMCNGKGYTETHYY